MAARSTPLTRPCTRRRNGRSNRKNPMSRPKIGSVTTWNHPPRRAPGGATAGRAPSGSPPSPQGTAMRSGPPARGPPARSRSGRFPAVARAGARLRREGPTDRKDPARRAALPERPLVGAAARIVAIRPEHARPRAAGAAGHSLNQRGHGDAFAVLRRQARREPHGHRQHDQADDQHPGEEPELRPDAGPEEGLEPDVGTTSRR